MKLLLEQSVVKWGLVLFLVLLLIYGNLVNGYEKMKLSDEERSYLRAYSEILNKSNGCQDSYFS